MVEEMGHNYKKESAQMKRGAVKEERETLNVEERRIN